MVTTAKQLQLQPDEFAFIFDTQVGVDASALAELLKQTAAIAQLQGGSLLLVGLNKGSLTAVFRAIGKSKVGQEFGEKPVSTSVQVTGLVVTIVTALVSASRLSADTASPFAIKSAELIDNHSVTNITIIDNHSSTVIMTPEIAKHVRAIKTKKQKVSRHETVAIRNKFPIIELASGGALCGEIGVIHNKHHFKPDGYHYWVPIIVDPQHNKDQTFQGKRFRVLGHIVMRNGQPDHISIEDAEALD